MHDNYPDLLSCVANLLLRVKTFPNRNVGGDRGLNGSSFTEPVATADRRSCSRSSAPPTSVDGPTSGEYANRS